MEATSPIFVGGTGRSGTTITAKLLGSHSMLHMIPIEVRFIVDPDGLCDYVAGRTDLGRFTRRMTGPWWRRDSPDGSTRGLHTALSQVQLDDAVRSLGASDAGDRLEASRSFADSIINGMVEGSGAARWIEMTPPNVARGNELRRLFPGMKLVHSLRDGRDVACSVAERNWGPNNRIRALDWWEKRMIEASVACNELGEADLHIVQMEDLIVGRRDEALQGLLEFLGIEADESLLRFHDEDMTPERSNIGRWVDDIDITKQAQFGSLYEQAIERLVKRGVQVPV